MIFFSIILKPDLKVNYTPQLNFVASLAIYDTLRPFLPREVAFNFKWPNDLLLNEKKFFELSKKLNNGKSKYSKGYEVFPDNFNDLMKAFDDLVGNEYSEDNRFVNYGEDEEHSL